MRFKRFLVFLLFISGSVQAYDFGDGSIDIPDGFEGPITQNLGQGASTAAYKYPHGNGSATLLQITTWNPGQKIPSMPVYKLQQGSKQYLLQLLGGVERKRTNFTRQDVEFIHISGHPAAKVAWSGEAQGRQVHGVMYCFIFNSKIYGLHTQDLSAFDGKYTSRAENAFESIKLER